MKLLLLLGLIVAPVLAQDTKPEHEETFVIYTEAENEALKSAFRDAFTQIEMQKKLIEKLKNATGCT